MNCSKCNQELPSSAKFCNECGSAVVLAEASAVAPTLDAEVSNAKSYSFNGSRTDLVSFVSCLFCALVMWFVSKSYFAGIIGCLIWLIAASLVSKSFKLRLFSINGMKLGKFYNLAVIIIAIVVHGNLREEEFKRAAEVESRLNKEKLQKVAEEFGKKKEAILSELVSLRDSGDDAAVIAKGKEFAPLDATVQKLVMESAQKIENKRAAEAEVEKITRYKEELLSVQKQVSDHMKSGAYKEVMSLTNSFPDEPTLVALGKEAKSKFSKEEEKRILESLKSVSTKDYKKQKELYAELLALFPSQEQYKKKYELVRVKADEQEWKERAMANASLQLIKWSWSENYGYATVTGQVKNITSERLQNVMAVVSFYDKNDEFITSDDALIDYNPILPGQSSPFKVTERWNPAMRRAKVEFKEMWGGTIEHYQDR